MSTGLIPIVTERSGSPQNQRHRLELMPNLQNRPLRDNTLPGTLNRNYENTFQHDMTEILDSYKMRSDTVLGQGVHKINLTLVKLRIHRPSYRRYWPLNEEQRNIPHYLDGTSCFCIPCSPVHGHLLV